MDTLETIPDGDAGLQVKLRRLRTLVDKGKRDPQMIGLARRIVANVPARNWNGEIAAVSAFTRRLRYTRDPVGVETFTNPKLLALGVLSGTGFGDCDDHVALNATLLEAIGHPTRFRVGGHGGLAGDKQWAHIWTDVLKPDSGWSALDDTAASFRPGFDPSPVFGVTATEQEKGPMTIKLTRAPMRKKAQPPRFYGGTSRTQFYPDSTRDMGGLGFGFRSITHAFKQITAPIVKVQRAVFVDIPKKVIGTQLNVIKKIAPIGAPIAANILAPGSGAIVSQFFRDPLNQQTQVPQPGILPPTGPPQGPSTYGPDYSGGGGGGSGDGYGGYTPTGTMPSWALPVALAGGGLLVVFLLMKKKR